MQYLWDVKLRSREEPTDSCKVYISTEDGNANPFFDCKVLQALYEHIALSLVSHSAPYDFASAEGSRESQAHTMVT